MWAVRMVRPNAGPELVELPVPEPGPGEVLVRVGGAGLCHSDLNLLYGQHRVALPVPFTLGHETAGWIEAYGPGTRSSLPVGTAVALYGAWGCGECRSCSEGAENYCRRAGMGSFSAGLGRDGGMAEFVVVPSPRFLVALPAGLDPCIAAPLTDAGLTPYHAIRGAAPVLRPGASAVVLGAGGLGHLAIQILKQTTPVRIVAIDRRPEALTLAKRCGADVIVDGSDDGGIAATTEAVGRADAVFDFVGSAGSVGVAAALAAPGGHIGLVGAGDGALPVSRRTVAPGVTVVFTYWGTRPELPEVMSLAAAGLISPTIEQYPLSRALDAYAAIEAGQITGRAVIVPDGVDTDRTTRG